jgi:hypothetical protein
MVQAPQIRNGGVPEVPGFHNAEVKVVSYSYDTNCGATGKKYCGCNPGACGNRTGKYMPKSREEAEKAYKDAKEKLLAAISDPDFIHVTRCKNCSFFSLYFPGVGGAIYSTRCKRTGEMVDGEHYCGKAIEREGIR